MKFILFVFIFSGALAHADWCSDVKEIIDKNGGAEPVDISNCKRVHFNTAPSFNFLPKKTSPITKSLVEGSDLTLADRFIESIKKQGEDVEWLTSVWKPSLKPNPDSDPIEGDCDKISALLMQPSIASLVAFLPNSVECNNVVYHRDELIALLGSLVGNIMPSKTFTVAKVISSNKDSAKERNEMLSSLGVLGDPGSLNFDPVSKEISSKVSPSNFYKTLVNMKSDKKTAPIMDFNPSNYEQENHAINAVSEVIVNVVSKDFIVQSLSASDFEPQSEVDQEGYVELLQLEADLIAFATDPAKSAENGKNMAVLKAAISNLARNNTIGNATADCTDDNIGVCFKNLKLVMYKNGKIKQKPGLKVRLRFINLEYADYIKGDDIKGETKILNMEFRAVEVLDSNGQPLHSSWDIDYNNARKNYIFDTLKAVPKQSISESGEVTESINDFLDRAVMFGDSDLRKTDKDVFLKLLEFIRPCHEIGGSSTSIEKASEFYLALNSALSDNDFQASEIETLKELYRNNKALINVELIKTYFFNEDEPSKPYWKTDGSKKLYESLKQMMY